MNRDGPPDDRVARARYDWVQEQEKTAELLEHLDSKLITADLHTHFMGMGDHKFWIDQIMRKHLFSYLLAMKDQPLESLEWYGPFCYQHLPNLEIVLKNAEDGSYSALYDKNDVKMKHRIDGYHFKLNPTSDPFTFSVTREYQSQTVTKEFTLSNWSLCNNVACSWDGIQSIDVKSNMKQRWLDIGLKDNDAQKVYTILNEKLEPVRFFDELVVNILRSYGEKECLNLPLASSLCKQLALMDDRGEIPPVKHAWDWQKALNFTTDVVFYIDAFQESMNIDKSLGEANTMHELIARLALNRDGDSSRYLKKYMFFNVKAQQFDYQWGINNTDLCYLMEERHGTELEAKATLAQIRNCFTMLNVDGSAPSNSDLVHRFRRHFTPEFYPMRFKLRDPIYEQHPYTLTLLLKNVLQNYAQSRTSYVEFSLSLKDLTTPWIYQYLVHDSIWDKIPGPDPNETTNGKRNSIEYRFLIGIPRNIVRLPIDGELKEAEGDEALTFLIRNPNEAMSHAFNPDAYSGYKTFFDRLKAALNLLNTTAHRQEKGILKTVVGLDFVSEELGYPYCPFIQDDWLDLASKFKLGIRLHCGEGVIREEKGRIAKAMYAHMFIMALAIRRICARGIKCRIGHGVAFQDCIVDKLTEEEKSFEQVPSSFDVHIPDGTRSLTPFLALISDLLVEVNITSNSYLVQHANSSSLIKLLENWLLCTDDDGVWAPPPCAHDHKLQAREYCRAISMGAISDMEDLKKAGKEHWTNFRFDHSEPHGLVPKPTELDLDITWSCQYQQPRAYSMIALVLCDESQEQLWTEAEKPNTLKALKAMGLIELLHSFGYYQGFEHFATTIRMRPPSMIDPNSNSWSRPDDHKIQYFLKLLNPDGDKHFGILRSLFLGYDKCLQLIWHETAIRTVCGAGTEFPMPCLVPGDAKDRDYRSKQANRIVTVCMFALTQIVKQIELIRQLDVVKQDQQLTRWIQARLALLSKRGRSEMEYGQTYSLHHQYTCPQGLEDQYDTSVITDKWIQEKNNNDDWVTIVKNAEKIDSLEGLVLCDAKYLQPHHQENAPSSYFNIVWNTQDWYIRPLPQSYFGPYAHVDPANVDEFHTVITRDDRVPLVWYQAALSIAKRLYNPTLSKPTRLVNKPKDENNPQVIRIAGVGYSGSAIAVLAGMMIATEMRHQEVADKRSVSNEVIVWTYGGKQFGSKSFHNKVHELSSYNLDITRWISLHDAEARNEDNEFTDELYASPFCSQKDIVVYPFGPPMIMSWDRRPSWHYFTLMLHHLPPCMELRDEVTKPNEMSIFLADDKRDLKSLAYSPYFPNYTLVCKHESDHNDYGPLTMHTRTIPADNIKIPPYVWKWDPQQHKSWKDIFDRAPVQTTIRFLGDLLLAISELPKNILISLSPHQCDIANFATMAPKDRQSLNDAKKKKVPEYLQNFMDLKHRIDTFGEEFCLLLLDFTYLHKKSDSDVSHIRNIRRPLEKAFSTPIHTFRHPESDFITNLEILLVILQNNDISNPFLHYILSQLDNMINEVANVDTHENEIKDKIIDLLRLGAPKKRYEWPLKTELEDSEVKTHIDSYKELFDKAAVGSYKSFDLALSLYFLNGKATDQTALDTCVFEVTLRRLWDATDWMSRRITQKLLDSSWQSRYDRAKEMLAFLDRFEMKKQLVIQVQPDNVTSKGQVTGSAASKEIVTLFLQEEHASQECKYMYQVESEKFQFLENNKTAFDVWTSLKVTLKSWVEMKDRKHHVMLGDALYRYGEQLWRSLSTEELNYLSNACQELVKQLHQIKNDDRARWVEAFLHYLLGLITNSSESFLDALSNFSALWEQLPLEPKDKCWIALHAACCSARVGDDVHIARAIYWIGYFFDFLKLTEEGDRDVALSWLRIRLESEEGDLHDKKLYAFIKPWLDSTTHSGGQLSVEA